MEWIGSAGYDIRDTTWYVLFYKPSIFQDFVFTYIKQEHCLCNYSNFSRW